MNKWHKTTGVVIIPALIVTHIWALSDYLNVADAAGTYCAEITQDSFFDCIFNMREHFLLYNVLSVLDIIFIIVMFICLWRKRGSNAYPSPIRIISTEKIILPFTFEKTYCRIGVITDGSGIERMETYFVRHDQVAICYKDSSFSQVVIDDAKYDKYDNYEMNTGTIVNIRMTEGIANYIAKLSDDSFIAFETLPKGNGELYENFTIISSDDDWYADYLNDYKEGTDIKL